MRSTDVHDEVYAVDDFMCAGNYDWQVSTFNSRLHRVMNEYGCSYCNRHFTTFTACVGHCVNEHNESQLKLKRGCLDPKTGLFKYKQLVFSITPSDITLSGHIIVPIEKTHDIYLSLTVPKPPNDASRESENCVDVPKQCTSSMQKGDNGAPPIHSGLLDDHDCPKAPTSGPTDKADEDAGDDINFVLSVQEFKTLTPRALDRLRDSGLSVGVYCMLYSRRSRYVLLFPVHYSMQ